MITTEKVSKPEKGLGIVRGERAPILNVVLREKLAKR